MSNLNKAQRDATVLHPAIRDAVAEVEKKLNAEKHPFKIFEAYRSPQRQAFLYSKGRSRPGPRVTKARPWSSFHQYGLAVDFVLFRPDVKGGWSWQTSGKWGRSWERLHEVADEFGLKPLSWEKPHLQIKGVSISDLRNGRYPEGGDEAWGSHLEAMIIGWGGQPTAPDVPQILPGRPPIEIADGADGEDVDADEDILRPAFPSAGSDTIIATTPFTGNHFPKVHPFVEKWEGGYVNHPLDRGGPTNMGITMRTLAAWRGRSCTPNDVKHLSRDEAWEIMKRRYYDVVHGDDLPVALALGAHNAAVLHGPKRSGEFLQKALCAAGETVEVDGIVGPETLGAVAKVDQSTLTERFFDAQRDYFRNIERTRPQDWRAFGKGWMNRFHDIKSSAHSFAQSISVPEPIDVPLPPIRPDEPESEKKLLHHALGRLIDRIFDDEDEAVAAPKKTVATKTGGSGFDADKVAAIVGIAEVLSKSGAIENKTLKAAIDALAKVDPEDARLTTVNGALGKTLGKMLNGRKTAIGIVGTLIVSLFGDIELGGGNTISILKTILSSDLATTLAPLFGASGFLMPLTLAMTAWGVLGKIEKWVVLRR